MLNKVAIVGGGIGGSALGPDLIVDALSSDRLRYDVAIVSNIDGYALENAVSDFDPAATLIVVALAIAIACPALATRSWLRSKPR